MFIGQVSLPRDCLVSVLSWQVFGVSVQVHRGDRQLAAFLVAASHPQRVGVSIIMLACMQQRFLAHNHASLPSQAPI
jgi:hypothetical protein